MIPPDVVLSFSYIRGLLSIVRFYWFGSCMVERAFSVNMYYSSPILLAKSNIEKLNFCQVSNVVCDGSP